MRNDNTTTGGWSTDSTTSHRPTQSSGCRSKQEHQNLQQFFRDLEAMTPRRYWSFAFLVRIVACQQISLERALELVNEAQNTEQWEELFDLEQHLNEVIAGVYR